MPPPIAPNITVVNPINSPNLRIVGTVNGDVDGLPLVQTYDNIQSAINSCIGASATNQFAVLLMPNVYSTDLTCRDYVHLVGMDGTVIKAQTSNGIVLATMTAHNIIFDQSSTVTDASTINVPCMDSCTINREQPDTAHWQTSVWYPGELDTFEQGSNWYREYAMMKFDFSDIPSSATITAAMLHMHTTHGWGGSTTRYLGGVMRPESYYSATWNKYDGINAWAGAGATGVGDISPNGQVSVYPGIYGGNVDISINVLTLAPELLSGVTHGIKIWGGTGYTTTIDPSSTPHYPYITVTYTGGGVPTSTLPAGKTAKLYHCHYKGSTLVTTAVVVNSGATLYIQDCLIDATIHRGVQSAGVVYSLGNTYQTSLTDLINLSGGTFYTAGDSYSTSLGTITPRGNADMVDSLHAGHSSGQIPVSDGTVNTNLNADMVDGVHITYDALYKCYIIQ